jgi:hypothetical protein
LAEYFVNPNPGIVSPLSTGPMPNLGPMPNVSPLSNLGPMPNLAPMPNVGPAFVNAAPVPYHCHRPLLNPDAILILFILLVIILRVR